MQETQGGILTATTDSSTWITSATGTNPILGWTQGSNPDAGKLTIRETDPYRVVCVERMVPVVGSEGYTVLTTTCQPTNTIGVVQGQPIAASELAGAFVLVLWGLVRSQIHGFRKHGRNPGTTRSTKPEFEPPGVGVQPGGGYQPTSPNLKRPE